MNEHHLNSWRSHSSESERTTRVKVNREQAKKTVGITLPLNLLTEARNRDLDINRICEQALQSIIYYMPQQDETESSKFLTVGSFLKETTRARSSVRLERRTLNP